MISLKKISHEIWWRILRIFFPKINFYLDIQNSGWFWRKLILIHKISTFCSKINNVITIVIIFESFDNSTFWKLHMLWSKAFIHNKYHHIKVCPLFGFISILVWFVCVCFFLDSFVVHFVGSILLDLYNAMYLDSCPKMVKQIREKRHSLWIICKVF